MYERKQRKEIDDILLVKNSWYHASEKENEGLDRVYCFRWPDITRYSIEAEAQFWSNFTLLTKPNSFRETKLEKENSIKVLDIALAKLENDIRALGE